MGALRTAKRKLSSTIKQKTRRERGCDLAIQDHKKSEEYKIAPKEEKRNMVNRVRQAFRLPIKKG